MCASAGRSVKAKLIMRDAIYCRFWRPRTWQGDKFLQNTALVFLLGVFAMVVNGHDKTGRLKQGSNCVITAEV